MTRLAVDAGVRVCRLVDAEPSRPLVRARGQRAALVVVIDEAANGCGQRGTIVRRHEEGGAGPVLTEAGDVAENERATGAGRLENGQTERLVARRQRIDGRTIEPLAERRWIEP